MKYQFIIVFIFIFQIVTGQNTANCSTNAPKEKIFLHTDRDLYITGEKIWFKAYCLEGNKLQSIFSKVIYLELFDDEKNAFIQKKYKLSQGTSSGALTIPSEINSGNYFLRAYTLYQRNFPAEQIYTQVVSIINPKSEYQEVKESKEAEESTKLNIKNYIEPQFITIKSSKSKYHQRELIDLSVNMPFEEIGNLSITVRKKGSGHNIITQAKFNEYNPWLSSSLLFNIDKTSETTKSNNHLFSYKKVEELEWIPELRSLTLRGIIIDKKTKTPKNNVTCLSSVLGDIPQIHLSETNNDGRFVFTFNELKEDQKLFLGVFNDKGQEKLEILVNSDFNTDFPMIKKSPLLFEKGLNQIYESIYLNYQLNKKFKQKKQVKAFSINQSHFSPFNLSKPDLSIEIHSFIDLPHMEDVFREIIPSVNIRGNMGDRHLSVFSKRDNVTYKNPLILLDNVPVSDIEKLLLIDPSLINTIDVYNSQYILGDHFLNGSISFSNGEDGGAIVKVSIPKV